MRIDPSKYADRLDIPQYTITEAALYLDIRPATLRSWVLGRWGFPKTGKKFYEPIISIAQRNPRLPSLSFYNLAEAHILAVTRFDHRVKLKHIRLAMDEVIKADPSPHPLLSDSFYSDGKYLFTKTIEQTVNLSKGRQLVFKSMLDPYLDRIIKDSSRIPIKLYPVRKENLKSKIVCMMPYVSSGRPIVDGCGVRVSVLWNRHRAGESIADLADDYGLKKSEIEQAIEYLQAA